MPRLPTPMIAWRFRSNVICNQATDLLHRAEILFQIKQSMAALEAGWTDKDGALAAPASSWSVVASSDSIAADGTDRWASKANLVWATDPAAHSWIVLKHSTFFGAGSQLQVCFDCSQSGAGVRNAALGVAFSKAGFNVGAPVVTTRPTAPDERVVLVTNGDTTTAPWQGPATNDAAHQAGRLHFLMSDDGRYVRWFIARTGATIGRGDLILNSDYDMATEWDIPALFCVYSFDSDVERMTADLARSDATHVYYGKDGLAVGDFTSRLEFAASTTSDTISANQPAISFSGAYGLRSIGLAGVAPLSGSFAAVPDLWWGNAVTRNQTFPGDSSNQFTQFGDLLCPWDRSVPKFS